MSHLDTAYKYGAAQAVNDFTSWLQEDDGNPTAPVITRKTAAESAVERALEKLGKTKRGKKPAAKSNCQLIGSISKQSLTKGTSFNRLKTKLKKRKGSTKQGSDVSDKLREGIGGVGVGLAGTGATLGVGYTPEMLRPLATRLENRVAERALNTGKVSKLPARLIDALRNTKAMRGAGGVLGGALGLAGAAGLYKALE